MNLETAKQLWAREAKAHGYVGFLVVWHEGAHARIMLHSEGELNAARNGMRAQGIEIIEEIWI